MLPINNPSLPAGITTNDIEIFAHGGCELSFLHNGKVKHINELPAGVKRELLSEMYADKPAMKALRRLHKSINGMFKHYVLCNYGGFDFIADSSHNGKKRHRESWNCGRQKSCLFYGKICKSIITARENDVLHEISTGSPDKWISERLNISKATLSVHKRNIGRKLNLHSKAEMTRFILNAGL